MNKKGQKQETIYKDLIALCGMNCAICSYYLSHVNDLKLSKCSGCRPSNKKCAYLYKHCSGPGKIVNNDLTFCFDCKKYPCKDINRMDKRYRTEYQMSIKDNLEYIKRHGIEMFAEGQYNKYRCPKCDNVISIHNRKCFKCDIITRLVEKRKCRE